MRVLMSVTYISADGSFGGPVSVALNQAIGLAEAGHEVTLLAGWDGTAAPRAPGVNLVLLRSRPLPRAGFIVTHTPRLRRWLRQNLVRFDLVHVHSGRHVFDVSVARAARRSGVPTILQPHGMIMPSRRLIIRAIDKVAILPMLQSASAVLALTDAEEADLRRLVPGSPVGRIRNGIRPGAVRGHERREEVLFLARLHPRKRVLAFAEAARLVHASCPGVSFRIVGPDEGDLPRLRAFMSANPEVPIHYEGTVAPGEATARLSTAAVFVLPSRGEVFPVTVLEAMSVGTPTILTEDCGIASELAQHRGALVSDGSSQDLADKIRFLLENPATRAALSHDAVLTVERFYSVASVVRTLVATYERATRIRGVLWLTNTAAPYRLPVWESLSQQRPLQVMLLESDKHLDRDNNNRGTDWRAGSRSAKGFTFSWLATVVLKRGEARFYLGMITRRHLADKTAIVLGGWESPVYWLAALQARRLGLRTVGFYESHVASQGHSRGPIARVRQWYFKMLDAVVTPGPAATEAVERMGVDPIRIHEGFNAVDVSSIHALARRTSPKRDDGTLRLLFVGQLIERKNIGTIINALVHVPDATLTVAGTGPLRATLERQAAEKLTGAARVSFLGYVPGDDVPALMLEHDVLVLPSRSEVWGLVVNEALACGLHVVISESAGVTRSVRDHPGVVVCQPDQESVSRALRRLPRPMVRISDPDILQHTPERFAAVFDRALTPERQS